MKIHRFIGQFDLTQPEVVIRDEKTIHQLSNVLWAKVGDQYELVSPPNQAVVQITNVKRNAITAKVLDLIPIASTSGPTTTLYCAILKRNNFELVVQKATEIGIHNIVPIQTQRTIKQNVRLPRLAAIMHEAAEQSGRTDVPTLHPIISFADAIVVAKEDKQVFFFHQSGQPFSVNQKQNDNNRSLFIGPEGGWTDEELTQTQDHNFLIVSLGNNTLRAETAAIVASYLVCQ